MFVIVTLTCYLVSASLNNLPPSIGSLLRSAQDVQLLSRQVPTIGAATSETNGLHLEFTILNYYQGEGSMCHAYPLLVG
ncbi:hypothetical protein EDC04DRAFT_2691140 [Pisolithus marmoratus]|nr:hypothetical protein EDC04DRAFT_2691140 [Pisolithus marmoratus]